MSLGRGRAPLGTGGAVIDPHTLAGASAIGADGFSGMTSPGNPIHTDPDAGRTDRLGHEVVLTDPQPASDLAPIPGVVDRPLFGGVRTAPAFGTLRAEGGNTGAHVVLRNRRSVVVLAPSEELLPAAGPALPSIRVAPVSDPLGRACANAAAAAGGGGA